MKTSIIPDFLSKLNIAKTGHFVSLKVEHTIVTLRLLQMFEQIGIIRGYHILRDENKIKVFLRYVTGSFSIFFQLKLVSKPSKRVFVDIMHLMKLKEKSGNDIFIISTPYGIMFDSQCLIYNIGGEVLIRIVM